MKNAELILFHKSLNLVASSFSVYSQPFIPMITFEPSKAIDFFSKGINNPCYRTLKIKNETDTSTIFEFGDTDEDFTIIPRSGFIKGKVINVVLLT